MRPVSATPEGWTALPTDGMRKAAFVVQDGDRKVEITAIDLPASAATMLPNVNRWRQQLQLDPMSDDELATSMEAIKVAGIPSAYIELLGPEQPEPRQAILGVVALRKGVAWFFKLSGDAGLALREKQRFQDYVTSVKFEIGGPERPPTAPHGTTPPTTAGAGSSPVIKYETPPGWMPGEVSNMRKAAFTVKDGEQSVTITAIDLPAAAGDVLANVNRWRRQVQLAAVTQDELEMTPIQVAGADGHYVEMMGPEDAKPRLATLAVMFVRADEAWFFKLSGDADLALREKEHFAAFVKSVSFVDGDGNTNDK